ncbi:MAG TPA: sigma-70 family RNA polymerase sigma factor [Thermoleophilaceae bacterium]|jgi:RNA polymerase sigma-70 factor (ECF subfamily)
MEGRGDAGHAAAEADRFTRLYRSHNEQILRYSFRRVGNWAEAEDVRSIVFYEAWRRRAEVDLTQPALPWLYGVAQNVIRNHMRASRRCEAAIRRLPRTATEPDLAQNIPDRLDASESARRALVLVGRLPPGERDVVLLCLLADRTYEEAASALGVPIGTVRSRLSRARRRLKRWSGG